MFFLQPPKYNSLEGRLFVALTNRIQMEPSRRAYEILSLTVKGCNVLDCSYPANPPVHPYSDQNSNWQDFKKGTSDIFYPTLFYLLPCWSSTFFFRTIFYQRKLIALVRFLFALNLFQIISYKILFMGSGYFTLIFRIFIFKLILFLSEASWIEKCIVLL